MALESGNYIDDLVITNPTASDPISQGDDHLQLIKKVVKQSFPSVDGAVHAIHPTSTEPATSLTAGLMWFDTAANLLKIRNEANDAWVTLAVSIITSNSVDINAGTIDGTTIESSIIGAATPAAGTFVALEGTAVKATSSLTLDTGVDMVFEGATADAYETTVTVTDPTADRTITLPNATDTLVGRATTDTLTNKTMTSSGNTFDDSTASVKGMASFHTDNFSVSSGAVTIKDAGVANAELADMAANTVKVRNANSSGVPSDLALATTEIMIGDGTGFTVAALSGDITMTNAGVVNVAKITGEEIDTDSAINDQVLKYSSSTSKWEKVLSETPDTLSGIGQLITYNGTADTPWAGGTTISGDLSSSYDGMVLTADSTLTYGMDWKENAAATAGFSVAMAIAL